MHKYGCNMILGAVNHSEYGDFKRSLQLHASAQVGSSTYKTSGIPQLAQCDYAWT